MNDPTVLGLYMQLFMFQQDSTRNEFVFCSPNHFIQYTLHSLARMLGLEYEYSLRPSQVRISRPPHTRDSDAGRLRDIQSQGTFHSTSAPERAGIQITQSTSPISKNLETTQIHPGEKASVRVALKDPFDKEPVDLEWDSKWDSKWDSYLTEESILDPRLPNGIRGNDFTSVIGNISPAVPFLNQNYLEVSAQSQTATGKHTPEGSTDSWPSSLEHEVSTSLRGGTTAVPVSADIQFIFEPTPTSGKSNPRGRQGPLNSSALTQSRAVKVQGGACWKCRILRKKVRFKLICSWGRKIKYMKCDTHEPCHECRKGDAGSVWRAIGCRRGTLGCEMRRMRICPRYETCTNLRPFPPNPKVEDQLLALSGICRPFTEFTQSSQSHRSGNSSAGPNQFPLESLNECLSTVLRHFQGKDLLPPSFRISYAPSSLLDFPTLSIFVVKIYKTFEYVRITSLAYPIDANIVNRVS
jgi:hypothetical protein